MLLDHEPCMSITPGSSGPVSYGVSWIYTSGYLPFPECLRVACPCCNPTDVPCRNPFSWQGSTLHSGTRMNILSKERTPKIKTSTRGEGFLTRSSIWERRMMVMSSVGGWWGGAVLSHPWVWEVWTRYLMSMWGYVSVKVRKHPSYRKLNYNGCILSQRAAIVNHYV